MQFYEFQHIIEMLFSKRKNCFSQDQTKVWSMRGVLSFAQVGFQKAEYQDQYYGQK